MCKSVNNFIFWSYQCCAGALKELWLYSRSNINRSGRRRERQRRYVPLFNRHVCKFTLYHVVCLPFPPLPMCTPPLPSTSVHDLSGHSLIISVVLVSTHNKCLPLMSVSKLASTPPRKCPRYAPVQPIS